MELKEALRISKDYVECNNRSCNLDCDHCKLNTYDPDIMPLVVQTLYNAVMKQEELAIEMPTYSDMEIGREK